MAINAFIDICSLVVHIVFFFLSSTHVIVHRKSHGNEKAFKCEICNKCFAHQGTLKAHQRIHTGEKAFACKICEVSMDVVYQIMENVLSLYEMT